MDHNLWYTIRYLYFDILYTLIVAMYLMPGTSTMHMCYALNNNWNSCYTHTQPFELNEWYNIRVAQADFQIIRRIL